MNKAQPRRSRLTLVSCFGSMYFIRKARPFFLKTPDNVRDKYSLNSDLIDSWKLVQCVSQNYKDFPFFFSKSIKIQPLRLETLWQKVCTCDQHRISPMRNTNHSNTEVMRIKKKMIPKYETSRFSNGGFSKLVLREKYGEQRQELGKMGY